MNWWFVSAILQKGTKCAKMPVNQNPSEILEKPTWAMFFLCWARHHRFQSMGGNLGNNFWNAIYDKSKKESIKRLTTIYGLSLTVYTGLFQKRVYEELRKHVQGVFEVLLLNVKIKESLKFWKETDPLWEFTFPYEITNTTSSSHVGMNFEWHEWILASIRKGVWRKTKEKSNKAYSFKIPISPAF